MTGECTKKDATNNTWNILVQIAMSSCTRHGHSIITTKPSTVARDAHREPIAERKSREAGSEQLGVVVSAANCFTTGDHDADTWSIITTRACKGLNGTIRN